MAKLSTRAKSKITKLIDEVVKKYISKAKNNPHSNSGNPFVLALLKDFEPLLHSVHGLKTSIGTEMEKIAVIIAKDVWGENNVRRKIHIKGHLPKNVFRTIDSIMNNLNASSKLPNYKDERKKIIQSC